MNKLKPLFFEQTLRHWHFEDLRQQSGISRERVNFYLKQLLKEHFVQRIKPRGKMPYYIACLDNLSFRMEKRLFGLMLLQESGLFDQVLASPDIKTAILFGSFSRGDWGKSSDVDLFLFGNPGQLNLGKCESRLSREIQVFNYHNPAEISLAISPQLLANIAKGFNIKGNLEPLEVHIRA